MILEKLHLGKLNPKNRFADIEVEIRFENERKEYKKLKAFIDTGAARSAVNEKLIETDFDLTNFKTKNSGSASGSFKSKIIPNVNLRLVPLLCEHIFIPLETIDTVVLDNDYDIIIGNDILIMCEFMYNGLSGTYLLKLFSKTE